MHTHTHTRARITNLFIPRVAGYRYGCRLQVAGGVSRVARGAGVAAELAQAAEEVIADEGSTITGLPDFLADSAHSSDVLPFRIARSRSSWAQPRFLAEPGALPIKIRARAPG